MEYSLLGDKLLIVMNLYLKTVLKYTTHHFLRR